MRKKSRKFFFTCPKYLLGRNSTLGFREDS